MLVLCENGLELLHINFAVPLGIEPSEDPFKVLGFALAGVAFLHVRWRKSSCEIGTRSDQPASPPCQRERESSNERDQEASLRGKKNRRENGACEARQCIKVSRRK